MEKLYILIDEIYKYVDDVVVRISHATVSYFILIYSDAGVNYLSMTLQEGRVAPDNRIGRFISDSVASMPKLSPAAFDKLFNDKIQVNYLCLLISVQVVQDGHLALLADALIITDPTG